MKKIFFDHNSTTKIKAEVLTKMNELYELNLNSSSVHYYGRLANKYVEESRRSLQNMLNANNYRVIFLSGGTEANNLAIFGRDYKKILFAAIEHDAIYNARPKDSEIIIIKTNKNGVIDLEDAAAKIAAIEDNNFLLSLMIANNETGAIQPVKELAKLVHQKGGLIHSDIIQGLGKIDIDLEDLNLDFASVSAHKIGAAQSLGALLVRKNLDIKPMIFGGGQESGSRSGTLNVPAIAGFGLACDLAKKNLEQFQKITDLRDYLEKSLLKIGGDNLIFLSSKTSRLANTSYFATKNIDKQTQLIHFDLNDIMVSTGSACSSGSIKPSRVLEAMELEKEFLNSAIRVSLNFENTKPEIDKFVNCWSTLYEAKYDS